MHGQGKGRSKKSNVDPSLGGGHTDDEATTGVMMDLPGNRFQKHPLLNELVMETLFKQYSLLNHEDSAKSVLARLAELRVVCKSWNKEVFKIVQKQTKIRVNKIISTYPNGLGWEATGKNDMPFTYSAPMPDEIGTFKNLDVTITTCEDLRNSSVLKWFQVMGSSVETLRLTCPLSCNHQNQFVERILKEWCPNLMSLTLEGVRCFESLLVNSCFATNTLEGQCSSLKEFVLSADDINELEWIQSCELQLEDLKIIGKQPIQNFDLRVRSYFNLLNFVGDLINYIDKAGEADTTVAEEEDLLTKLVRRPIGLATLNGLAPRSIGTHVPGFFQQSFVFDTGYENDGGIVGQLMKMSRITKFVMKKQGGSEKGLLNELFAMVFYRPNLWKSTVKIFECVGDCSAVTGGGLGDDNNYNHIFSKLLFPLKRLKIDYINRISRSETLFDPVTVRRILTGYAGTLEELEIKLKNGGEQNLFSFPFLPNVKSLVVHCEIDQVVNVSCEDILEKFPKLERCTLSIGTMWRRGLKRFFENSHGGSVFMRNESHPLKELKLVHENLNGDDVERLVVLFPNLKIVELSVGMEVEDFKVFWEKMGDLPLEQVKLTFSGKSRSGSLYGLYEKAIKDSIERFIDLQSLELVHEAAQPFPLTLQFARKFANVGKLRFLKFTNFQINFYGRFAGNEVQEIKESLPNVVVQLPSVSSPVRMKRKLVNVE